VEKIAILVDGGFYRKRANVLAGKKEAEERADELFEYCLSHLREEDRRDAGKGQKDKSSKKDRGDKIYAPAKRKLETL